MSLTNRVKQLETTQQTAHRMTWREFISMPAEDFVKAYETDPQFKGAWDALLAQAKPSDIQAAADEIKQRESQL